MGTMLISFPYTPFLLWLYTPCLFWLCKCPLVYPCWSSISCREHTQYQAFNFLNQFKERSSRETMWRPFYDAGSIKKLCILYQQFPSKCKNVDHKISSSQLIEKIKGLILSMFPARNARLTQYQAFNFLNQFKERSSRETMWRPFYDAGSIKKLCILYQQFPSKCKNVDHKISSSHFFVFHIIYHVHKLKKYRICKSYHSSLFRKSRFQSTL